MEFVALAAVLLFIFAAARLLTNLVAAVSGSSIQCRPWKPALALALVSLMVAFASVAMIDPSGMTEKWARNNVARNRIAMEDLVRAIKSYHADRDVFPPQISLIEFAKDKNADSLPAGAAQLGTIDPRFFRVQVKTGPRENESALWPVRDPFNGYPLAVYFQDNQFLILSTGPDRDFDINPIAVYTETEDIAAALMLLGYDPTNGSVSSGDIWKTGQVN